MKTRAALLAVLLCPLLTIAAAHAQTLPTAKPEQVGLSAARLARITTRLTTDVEKGVIPEYNWGGAGGTYFWVDPREDLFVVFTMQSPKQRVPYRAVLKDMIYAAIMKPAGK